MASAALSFSVPLSVPGVVRVSFQNREGAVDLLEQDDAGELVSERHLAKRQHRRGRFSSFDCETVGWTDREDKRLGIAILVMLEELREFL